MKMVLMIFAAVTVAQVALALEPELGGAVQLDFSKLGKGPWVSSKDVASTWQDPSAGLDTAPSTPLLGRRELLQECAALWGKCGGKNYDGPTCCSAGECKKSNDYYSQCLCPDGGWNCGSSGGNSGGIREEAFVEERDSPVESTGEEPVETPVETPSGGGRTFRGDATYYQDGTIGACSQQNKPSGFRTVALNSVQWDGSNLCGTCIQGQYTENTGTVEFKAIIDNLCPECSFGDLDFRIDGIGSSDGRWPLEWSIIPCPSQGLTLTRENGNKYYAKLKVEGGPSPVTEMECEGMTGSRTTDSFFEFQDASGTFCAGGECTVTFSTGGSEKLTVSRSDLGNFC